MSKYTEKGFAPIIIIIAVVLLAGIGGGAYYMSQKGKTPTSPEAAATDTAMTQDATTATETTNQSADGIERITASFFDLAGNNRNLECDWKPEFLPDFKVAKVWISGSKVRSHIEATENMAKQPIVADAVFKDGGLTSWVGVAGMKPVGFKMTKEEIEKANTDMTPEQKKQADQYMKKSVYECKAWTVDESKFEVPADVTFYK